MLAFFPPPLDDLLAQLNVARRRHDYLYRAQWWLIHDKCERGGRTSGAEVSGGCARGGCGSSARSAKEEEVNVYVNTATDEGKRVMPGNAARARMFLRVGDE
jgi:hypothetical protein